MKMLPPLYQKTNTGAIQSWEISVTSTHEEYGTISVREVGVITTTYGQVGGKAQVTTDTVREGKNLGKKNATSAYEQACLEAEAKWRKKKEREGYVEELERVRAGETDQAGGIQPMLAKPLDDINAKYLKWPAAWQRKFNGNRGLAMVNNSHAELWSRKQKLITGVPHLTAALNEAFEMDVHDDPVNVILDGEVYRHGWSLQKISGFFRKEGETKPGYEELGYFVYDLPSHTGTWEERQVALRQLFQDYIWPALGPLGPIHLVETITVDDMDHAWGLSKKAVRDGYEGGILRQLAGRYEAGKRSPYLGKLKNFIDAEFEITGVVEGRGKFEGKAIFNLKAANGNPFDCCAPGTMEDRAEFFRRGAELIGKKLTVRYFELSEAGTPLFPVGIAVRDYE